MTRLVRVDPKPPASATGRRGYLVRGPVAPVFVERGALSPADAMPFKSETPSETKAFDKLRRSGAIRQAGANWWLDIVAYQADADARSRRVVPWLIVGSLVIAALATLFYQG